MTSLKSFPGRDGVDNGRVLRPLWLAVDVRVAEDETAERGLPAPRWADNDADAPVVFLDGQLGIEGEVCAGLGVEERLHAGRTIGVELRAAVADLDEHQTTTTRHS